MRRCVDAERRARVDAALRALAAVAQPNEVRANGVSARGRAYTTSIRLWRAWQSIKMYHHKEANSLVEEFMLFANIAVAKQIESFFPSSACLRTFFFFAPSR